MSHPVVAFGPNDSYFVESPAVWGMNNLPEQLQAHFAAPSSVKHVYFMFLGANESFFMTYLGKDGNDYMIHEGLTRQLDEWLSLKDDNGYSARNIPQITMSLGQKEKSFFVADNDEKGWSELPKNLEKALGTLRNPNGTWMTLPRHISLGVNDSFVLLNHDNSGAWDLRGQYPFLQQHFESLKQSATSNGFGIFKDINSVYLNAFEPGYFVLTTTKGEAAWAVPDIAAKDTARVMQTMSRPHSSSKTSTAASLTPPTSSGHVTRAHTMNMVEHPASSASSIPLSQQSTITPSSSLGGQMAHTQTVTLVERPEPQRIVSSTATSQSARTIPREQVRLTHIQQSSPQRRNDAHHPSAHSSNESHSNQDDHNDQSRRNPKSLPIVKQQQHQQHQHQQQQQQQQQQQKQQQHRQQPQPHQKQEQRNRAPNSKPGHVHQRSSSGNLNKKELDAATERAITSGRKLLGNIKSQMAQIESERQSQTTVQANRIQSNQRSTSGLVNKFEGLNRPQAQPTNQPADSNQGASIQNQSYTASQAQAQLTNGSNGSRNHNQSSNADIYNQNDANSQMGNSVSNIPPDAQQPMGLNRSRSQDSIRSDLRESFASNDSSHFVAVRRP